MPAKEHVRVRTNLTLHLSGLITNILNPSLIIVYQIVFKYQGKNRDTGLISYLIIRL
jgi:hypothetical protein